MEKLSFVEKKLELMQEFGDVGKYREATEQLKKYKSLNGTPIMIQEMEYHASSSSGKAHATRPKIFQFPLRLGWANTSHK